MLFNKPLASIDEQDIQSLVLDQVPESKTIDYKQGLPGDEKEDKKEFLADASSFANAAGGYLIFGIKEQSGVPTEMCGFETDDVDAQKLRLESMLRDGIAPRLPRIDIHVVQVTSKSQHYVLILSIQKSWLSPHRVIFRDHGHFYARNSAGKYRLDVSESRTEFDLSSTRAEQIKAFRVERLSKIGASEETPTPLDEQAARLVLHIIPFGAFNPTTRPNLSLLEDPPKRYLSSPFSLWSNLQSHGFRYNLDGVVNYTHVERVNTPTTSYVQVFHNGIVEALDLSILNASRNNRVFSGILYEQRLIQAVVRYGELQKLLGVEPPWFLMVSLMGMKGYRISHPMFQYGFSEHSGEIDRAHLVIPEVMINDFDNIAMAMKPIFNTIWNAAGHRGSPNYDASGNCTLEL